MKTPKLKITLGLGIAALAVLCAPAYSQVTTFTGAVNNQYTTSGNWSGGAVPNLTTGSTALINNGAAVTYTPGGDLLLSNGGTLQVTNGSWTQVVSNNWIQLQGNGHIVIDGGTFTQGTAGNNPFNTSGTGNTFAISSGSAAFNSGGIQVNAPLTWTQSGGNVTAGSGVSAQGGTYLQSGGTLTSTGGLTITSSYTQSGGVANFTGNGLLNGTGSWTQSGGVANLTGNGTLNGVGSSWTVSAGTINLSGNLQLNSGAGAFLLSSGTINVTGEVDFSNIGANSLMTGGVLNITKKFTMVNGPTGSTFNFSGGLITDLANDGDNGWYGSGTASPFNFTLGSSGTLQFLINSSTNTVSQTSVQNLVNAGDIKYNGATNAAAFNVIQSGSFVNVTVIPEPSTYALMGLGALGFFFLRRKKAGPVS